MAQYIQSDERKKCTTNIIRIFYPARLSFTIDGDKAFTDKQKLKSLSPINWPYKKC